MELPTVGLNVGSTGIIAIGIVMLLVLTWNSTVKRHSNYTYKLLQEEKKQEDTNKEMLEELRAMRKEANERDRT